MCEFCAQHGEGKTWYLAVENYSRDLLDDKGRVAYATHFLNTFEAGAPAALKQLDALARTPFHGIAKPYLTRRQKRDHFGQVTPIEEVEQIFQNLDSVVRLPCVCRRALAGKQDARFCYGLTTDPRLTAGLDDSFSLEVLTPAEALDAIRTLDKEGLVHSVWTFKSPYIAGLCNCDQDCMAYRVNHARGYFQVMFRAEFVAAVDRDRCNGCKNCMRQCQYGAIRYSAVNKKVVIDPLQCYGCGVCRAACHRDAIRLHARAQDPVAARIW